MKILMVASEAAPFAKTGGLADVLGALPAALTERGENVAVVIPAYRENRYPITTREAYRNLFIPLGPGYMVDILRTTGPGVTYYFVDCPALYDRDGIYGAGPTDFPDNHLRFAVLSLAALGVARHLFPADLLHLHDWQAALAAVYLREHFRGEKFTEALIHGIREIGAVLSAHFPRTSTSSNELSDDVLEG